MFRYRNILILATIALPHSPLLQAHENSSGQRKGPPSQAIEACAGKAAGTACNFTGRNGEQRHGNCFQPPQRQVNEATAPALPLACRPEKAAKPAS